MGPLYLGPIHIDDAAGYSWSVDPTPFDDAESRRLGDQRERARMDLVSVVAHELGHLLVRANLPGEHNAGHLMGESLSTGTRRVPTSGDVTPAATASAPRPADGSETVVTPAAPVRQKAMRRR
jgi:hypothetical protein